MPDAVYSREHACAILIPAYNSVATLGALLSDLRSISNLSLVVVDDGSTDGTAVVATARGAHCLSHPRNCGKGAALATGFRYLKANGFSHALTIDADGQHDILDIQKLLRVEFGVEIVLGARKFSYPMPVIRRVSNTLTSLVVSIATSEMIKDSQCGYRRYRLDTLLQWPLYARRFSYESELLFAAAMTGTQVLSVPIATRYRGERSAIVGGREIFQFVAQGWKFLWR